LLPLRLPNLYLPDEDRQRFHRSKGSATPVSTSDTLDDVLRHYEVAPPEAADIARFLSEHPYLSAVLGEAIPHLRRVFGSAPVRLLVHTDPEDGFEELFGIVIVSASPEAALSSLARFDDEWFNEASTKTRCKLNFTVGFPGDEAV